MVDPIRPVGPEMMPAQTGGVRPPETSFKNFLTDQIRKVNDLQQEADQAVKGAFTGQTQDVTEVLGAVKKAEVAFDLLMEVRNKVVDAYQEIMRMRV
ncbi:MAG: flagellar hook-basal body complex protein FliE [Planctomycetota bacterium]